MELQIQVKQAGQKENKVVKKTIVLDSDPDSVRALIEGAVRATLSQQPPMEKKISEEEAIDTAIQAFSDGLVALFIDDCRHEHLDETLHLCGTETLTFVKLTLLAGRMW